MFEDQSRYYVVSELCAGGELFDYIATRKHLSESMAAGIIRQVLSAVAYCHEHHIVHRDLKPENLLLDAPPTNTGGIQIKVIDFGTSCLCSENERLKKKLGTAYYIAPEVLSMSYNEKCDIWSCGVILYILLSGYPPFAGQTDEEIMQKVKVGKFNFAHQNWRLISDSAKQLIKRMLTMNPAVRPSAMDCLQTPWLNMLASSAEKTAPDVTLSLNNLQTFHHSQKLRQAFLGFITAQMRNKEHEQQLALEFRALDKNGDGKLSREELVEAYKSSMPLAQAELTVDNVMRQVDSDGSGFIDYSEFIAACANHQTLLSRTNLKTAFDAFDKDHSGKISAQELRAMLDSEGAVTEEVWSDLIRQADLNGDGEIEYEEFARLMLEAAVSQ
jgi:calcium-dependent protein kinase